ncbi:hypothetical protein HDV03_001151 [Kappamyces sp. JEL0829]|nr:hypothetical protein HDV03_001151 [Kappamyces sp. JEL0829]
MSIYPVLATAFGIQAAGYAIAAPLQTDRFYDLTGALTFASCVGLLVGMTTLVWCGRLGSFLFYRILKDGKDSRFDKIKKARCKQR